MPSRRFVILTILLAGIVLVCGAFWSRIHASRAFFNPPVLLSRFPAEDALVLSADFSALRGAEPAHRIEIPLEPEYKQFREEHRLRLQA